MGSSVVVALAAVLWLVYLVPTWFRRREYVATERNAVRLQQTLRILAETAEVPEPVHVEATARSVAAQQKLLRQEYERAKAVERAREASMSRAAARTLATLKPAVASAMITHSSAAVRLRRSRATTSFVALLAVIAAVAGIVGASTVLVVSAIAVLVGCVALLNRMAAVAKSRAMLASTLAQRPAVRQRLVEREPVEQPQARGAGWVPVPLQGGPQRAPG